MFVVRALRGLLKIRYILLGGAVGGGVTLQKVFGGLWGSVVGDFCGFCRNSKIGKTDYRI